MNTERYDGGRRKSGIETKSLLKSWFEELLRMLSSILFAFDKVPNKRAGIHVLKKSFVEAPANM
jgi:hypothetical protein